VPNVTTANLTYPDNVIQTHRFQYCPMCRAPLERTTLFADNIPRIHCARCGWIQLLTNCICVAVVIRHQDGIVVIHPPDGLGAGFPAGIVEYDEDPKEAAVREAREETGLEIEIVQDLGWSFARYPDFPGPTLYVLFAARATGGTLREGDEGPVKREKHAWTTFSNLPGMRCSPIAPHSGFGSTALRPAITSYTPSSWAGPGSRSG
jgi:ADP-ribose pyrophosphatase YjhB (NUDIX family)